MAERGVDVDLLETTMTYIRDHPTEHNQATWGSVGECGTVACFAGHAVMLGGGELHFDSDLMMCATDAEGVEGTVPATAREMLGLNYDQSQRLFWGGNTVDELELMVKALANGEPLPEHPLDNVEELSDEELFGQDQS